MKGIMKPFSLEEHLKNPERKVVTRNGRKVRIACVDRKDLYCVIGLISLDSDHEEICCYTINGECTLNAERPNDLFFAPEIHEGWINVYRNMAYNEAYCGRIYDSYEEAKSHANNATLATAQIEWEE